MRLSELNNKEIIDVDHGERIGLVGQTELLICEDTGAIEAFIYQPSSIFSRGKKRQDTITIPWRSGSVSAPPCGWWRPAAVAPTRRSSPLASGSTAGPARPSWTPCGSSHLSSNPCRWTRPTST